jgi:hypothetical protein
VRRSVRVIAVMEESGHGAKRCNRDDAPEPPMNSRGRLDKCAVSSDRPGAQSGAFWNAPQPARWGQSYRMARECCDF